MNIQRLRNLTTGRLPTKMSDIYEDLEYLTGMSGLMTPMLPNVLSAITPILKSKIVDEKFWDENYDTEHTGEYEITPMNEEEKKEFLKSYEELEDPLAHLRGH